jgi:hypothetical protein
MRELGFSLVTKRDDYTGRVVSCGLEVIGASMQMDDGTRWFFGFAAPASDLAEFEKQLDLLLDQLNRVRKDARVAFQKSTT